jgi:hypothetical protein
LLEILHFLKVGDHFLEFEHDHHVAEFDLNGSSGEFVPGNVYFKTAQEGVLDREGNVM